MSEFLDFIFYLLESPIVEKLASATRAYLAGPLAKIND